MEDFIIISIHTTLTTIVITFNKDLTNLFNTSLTNNGKCRLQIHGSFASLTSGNNSYHINTKNQLEACLFEFDSKQVKISNSIGDFFLSKYFSYKITSNGELTIREFSKDNTCILI